MSNFYIEARPKGSPVEDYMVEEHADDVLSRHKNQQDAIDWAKAWPRAACRGYGI
jgi:hypothetical protein